MELEDALQHLGKYGRWQVINYILIALATCPIPALHTLAIVFLGTETRHNCKLPTHGRLNDSIPLEVIHGELQFSQCNMYDVTHNNTETNVTHIVPCNNGYDYHQEPFRTSIVSEFDLVCERAVLVGTTQFVFDVGMVIGDVLFTWMSDRIGRKSVLLFSHAGLIVVNVIGAFANSYEVFTVTRLFCGAFEEGVLLAGFAMACELLPAKQRTFSGITVMIFWPLGMFLLALMSYVLPQWRHLQLAITLIGVLTFPLYWILSESLNWLIAKGRYKEAEEIIRKAAKMNKVTLPETIFIEPEMAAMMKKEEEARDEEPEPGCWDRIRCRGSLPRLLMACCRRKETTSAATSATGVVYQASFCDVMKSRKLIKITLVMSALWFVNALVYYGISLTMESLPGSLYVNFSISAAVEIVASVCSIFVLQRFGRRKPLCVYHFITGVALLFMVLPDVTEGGINLVPLKITLTMIGKFGIASSFGVVFLFAVELYPTTIRNLCLGICSVALSIGGFIAPYSAYVAKFIPWLPSVVFGTLSCSVGLLAIYLPETLNKPLPKTIQDVENLTRSLRHTDETNNNTQEKLVLQVKEDGEKCSPKSPNQKKSDI